ncbi:hypothetical protein K0T92_10345 [Paenibacillus oenotherae]|uniref:Alpha/beta hydrolase n=1 Tax=Paenibacillus oenotherae TaxID=1435645 RepID=A0ABS7D5C5_9BACL|nr:alpha/beta hydrolase [Paenibacillus oenotherae]MBW7475147.1 hypothetical protein [Paenibacillus oenotherae]
MTNSAHMLQSQQRSSQNTGTILWLSGWSIADAAFDSLRGSLPEWRHAAAGYAHAESPEQFYAIADAAARECRQAAAGPLLLAGWSLGSLIALRLAWNGLANQPPSGTAGGPADGTAHGLASGTAHGLAGGTAWKPGGSAGSDDGESAVLPAGGSPNGPVNRLVDGLILLSGTACFVRPKGESSLGWPDIYVRQMSSALKQNREAVEIKFRETLLTASERLEGYSDRLPPAGSWSTEALLAGLGLLRSEDCRPLLPGLAIPSLLIHGTDDTVCPPGAAQELCHELPDAQYMPMAGSGHAVGLTRYEETADAIRRWWHGQQAKNDTAPIQPQRGQLL